MTAGKRIDELSLMYARSSSRRELTAVLKSVDAQPRAVRDGLEIHKLRGDILADLQDRKGAQREYAYG